MFASRTRSRRPSNFKPQTIIFAKSVYTKAAAAKWARDHRYSARKVTVEKDGIHVRQHGPADIVPGTQATVRFGPHIRVVFARLRPAVMRRVYGNSEPPSIEEITAYNGALAKLFQRLKQDAGAERIAQNYRGTGSQVFRRQLWVRFKSGAVIDLWLERAGVKFGGVVKHAPPGRAFELPRGVAYEGKTPAQVYAEVAPMLRAWANPGAGSFRRRATR